MSGYLMGRVWHYHIDRGDRDVLLAMADHAHDDGTHIYPSMDKLAWKLDISKRQVQRIVSRLRERGVLIVVREATRYDPTHYRMDLSVFDAKMPLEDGDAFNAGMTNPSPLPGRGDVSRTAGMTLDASRGDVQASPEPSIEPSIEPPEQQNGGASDLERVWAHYQEVRPNGARCKLNPDDARLIREALKVRPIEDILAAIDGLFRSQWHLDGGFIGIKYAVRGGGQRPNAGATIDRLANGRGGTRLKDRLYRGLSWDELTPHAQASAKESMAMGLEVWDGGKDSWEGAEERRAAAAAVTAERRRNGQVPAGAWDLAGDD